MGYWCLPGGWETPETGGRGGRRHGCQIERCAWEPTALHRTPMPFHPLIKPPMLAEPWSGPAIAHSGSFLLGSPHPPAQTHENTQVFTGRLLAVNGANYMVQAPMGNSGDMTFPPALGALGGVLSGEGTPRWVGRVAQGPPGGAGGSHCSRKARSRTPGRTSYLLQCHFEPTQLGVLQKKSCFPRP